MNNKEIDRKKGFKKGVDTEEGRRRREETTLQIRKNKKDDRLSKRRQMQSTASVLTTNSTAPTSMVTDFGMPNDQSVTTMMNSNTKQ